MRLRDRYLKRKKEEGPWISNLVITDKKWDGAHEEGRWTQIRANLDLRLLNTFVYQTHKPIPTPEELRVYKHSSLDMIHSFHQFVLEEEARKLFCFRARGAYSASRGSAWAPAPPPAKPTRGSRRW
jgi:hypothetical protein